MLLIKATKPMSDEEIKRIEGELSEKTETKVVIIPSGFEIIAQGN